MVRRNAAAMPRIHYIPGPYRLFFLSDDCHEPEHVHVKRDRDACKFWLTPLRLANNRGFSAAELSRIRDTILEYRPAILEVWREHCCKSES